MTLLLLAMLWVPCRALEPADVLGAIELAEAAGLSPAAPSARADAFRATPVQGSVVELVKPTPNQDMQLRHHPRGSQVWDASTGRDVGALLAVHALVGSVSRDGRQAVTVHPDWISGWEVATGKRLWRTFVEVGLHCGERASDDIVERWEPAGIVRVLPEVIAVRTDLRRLITGIPQPPELPSWLLLDPATGKLLWRVYLRMDDQTGPGRLGVGPVEIVAASARWISSDPGAGPPAWNGVAAILPAPKAGDLALDPYRSALVDTQLSRRDPLEKDTRFREPSASSNALDDGGEIESWKVCGKHWVQVVDGTTVRWKTVFDTQGFAQPPIAYASGDAVVVLAGENAVEFDAKTGSARWRQEIDPARASTPR